LYNRNNDSEVTIQNYIRVKAIQQQFLVLANTDGEILKATQYDLGWSYA